MRWSGVFGLTCVAGVLLDDLAAELDALVADVDRAGPGDQTPDLVLVLAAERAVVGDPLAAAALSCCYPSPMLRSAPLSRWRRSRTCSSLPDCSRISSIRPYSFAPSARP